MKLNLTLISQHQIIVNIWLDPPYNIFI